MEISSSYSYSYKVGISNCNEEECLTNTFELQTNFGSGKKLNILIPKCKYYQ